MQLPIYLYGQNVLRKATEEVPPDYPGLAELIANMLDTVSNAEGVGLAAPQVGVSIRLFVIDLTQLPADNPSYADYKKVFINPSITEFSEDTCVMEEGCLSVPDIHENVSRSNKIRIRFQDEKFVGHEQQFEDYEARVLQHEYDHLQGKVFTDRISPIRKQLIKSKLASIIKGKTRPDYKFR